MLTKDFINTTFSLPDGDTTIEKALKIATDNRLEQFPACINGHYGFFFNVDLEMLPQETTLNRVEQLMKKNALNSDDHIWESIRSFHYLNTDVLPVTDKYNNLLGVVLMKDIFKRVFDIFPIGNGGAILELELSYNNYSLHELSGIVENTNSKITLLSIFPIEGTTKVNVVFSINKKDATEVIQALERHSYHVNAWFMNKGKIDHIQEERYEALMNYINV